MNPEKVGKCIRELSKENNLTQADLAKKYGVTYQAVSKWENGINLPDITLLKEMSKDFNIGLEDILEGEKNYRKRSIWVYVIGTILVTLIIVLIILLFIKKDSSNFSFKTLSTTCKEFKVTGSIAYDSKKSSINISNIDYCGGDDKTVYDTIECELFEEEHDKKALVSKCNKVGKKEKLEDYLKEVEVKVDDYKQQCSSYAHNKLYLEIKAIRDNKTTIYKIDLSLNNNCLKDGD